MIHFNLLTIETQNIIILLIKKHKKMKYMKKIALALVIGCSCMALASCSEDGIGGLIDIIGGLFDKGETYTYDIQVSKAKIWTNLTNADKIAWSDTTSFRGQQVQLVANKQGATITLPDYDWNMVKVSGLKLYNMDITANGDFSELSINEDNTRIDGTFTIKEGNKTYAAYYCELTTAIVSQTDILIQGTIQFANTKADGSIDISDVQQLDIIQLMKSTTPAQ